MVNDSEVQLERCLNNLSYHKPDPDDPAIIGDMGQVRDHAKALAKVVDRCAPDGRDKAVAFTKIEEACQASIAAVVRGRGVRQPDYT